MGPRRGQTTAEYAIVLGVVLMALIAMQVYVKRGINARLRDASDTATEVVAARPELGIVGAPKQEYMQYEPYYASSTNTIEQSATETRTANLPGAAGKFGRTGVSETTARKRLGSQTTGAIP